jgi:hypothetical protein
MREMASTEALDREIREEARRRAAHLLREADKEAAALALAAEESLAAELEALSAAHAGRKEQTLADQAASLPLEEKRLRLAWIGGELEQALRDALAGLPAEDWWAAVAPRLAVAAEGLGDGPLAAEWSDCGPDAGERLRACLPGRAIEARENAIREATGGSPVAGRWFELRRADSRRRFRIGDAELAAWLLETHRAELARTLFPDLFTDGDGALGIGGAAATDKGGGA